MNYPTIMNAFSSKMITQLFARITACFLIILMGLLISFPALAASSYYIDFNGGDDNNDGLSIQAPFKHCPGDANATGSALATVLKAGDTVIFKKGVIYDGQITMISSGLKVTDGLQGRISEEGILSDLQGQFKTSGVQSGDFIYIYNMSTTGSYIETCGLWTIASIISENQMSLSGFDGLAHSSAELAYIIFRPITVTSSSNFGSGEAVLRAGNTQTIRPDGVSYIRFADLKFTNTLIANEDSCLNANLAAIWDNHSAEGWIVENCTFAHVQGAVGGNLNHSVIRNNTVTDWGGMAVVAGEYVLVEGNTFITGMSTIRGIGKFSIVRHNKIIDAARSAADYCGHHANAIGPFFSPSAAPGSNQYGWIYGNYISNTVMGIFLEFNNGGTSNWTIHSNVLVGHAGAGGSGSSAIELSVAPNTKIFNNVIFGINGSHGWSNAIKLQKREGYGPSPNCQISNNIIYSLSTGAPGVNIVSAESGVGLVAKGNIYYTPNRSSIFGFGGVLINWSEWNSKGFDTDQGAKFGTDPMFVQPTGQNWYDLDLHLSGSSKIPQGATSTFTSRDVESKYRFEGTQWRKGAYENQQALSLKAPTGVRLILQ